MSLRSQLLKWSAPSKWVETINGNKTYLGLIAFTLWALIYAVPTLCKSHYCLLAAQVGAQAQSFFVSIGLNLSAELLNLASILTFVGLADKIVKHNFTKIALGILRLIEEPIAKLIEKGEASLEKGEGK